MNQSTLLDEFCGSQFINIGFTPLLGIINPFCLDSPLDFLLNPV